MDLVHSDEMIFSIIESCDSIVTLRTDSSSLLSRAWLNLAKARYQRNTTCNSTDDIRSDINADIRINMDGFTIQERCQGPSPEALMMISALPNTYMRNAQKNFIEALKILTKLAKEQQSVMKKVNPNLIDDYSTLNDSFVIIDKPKSSELRQRHTTKEESWDIGDSYNSFQKVQQFQDLSDSDED